MFNSGTASACRADQAQRKCRVKPAASLGMAQTWFRALPHKSPLLVLVHRAPKHPGTSQKRICPAAKKIWSFSQLPLCKQQTWRSWCKQKGARQRVPPDELQELLARRGLRFSGDTSIWRMWFLFVSYEGESQVFGCSQLTF